MNILESSFRYIEDILNDNMGIKAVVTDSETLTVLSLSMTRTELFSHDVIQTAELTEIAHGPVNNIASSLKCVCILRPTVENVDILISEISRFPHYSRYSIYFTNSVTDDQLHLLAQCDKYALITHIEEVYLDYFPLNTRLFSLNLSSIIDFRKGQACDPLITRIAEGLYSSLCSLQMKPLIRYSSGSSQCKTIAQEIATRIQGSPFGQINTDSVLLILDRRSDPISAILHPWFYIGAIHDLFHIKNNLVSVPDKNEPIVFDERHDGFIHDYGCKFLADVGPAIADRMAEAKRLNGLAKQVIRSPDQIAEVVNAATQFQEQFQVAGSHVNLIENINKEVSKSNLLSVSEIEQSLAVADDPSGHFDQIMKIAPTLPDHLQLRLLLLFTLRYENRASDKHNALRSAFPIHTSLLDAIIKVCGTGKRGPDDVFASRAGLGQLFSDIRMLVEADQKVLDQYHPLLSTILARLKKGQLSGESYPFIGAMKNETMKPSRVVVFYVGGATYSEMRAAVEASSNGFEIVVGGTTIHNSDSFINTEVLPSC